MRGHQNELFHAMTAQALRAMTAHYKYQSWTTREMRHLAMWVNLPRPNQCAAASAAAAWSGAARYPLGDPLAAQVLQLLMMMAPLLAMLPLQKLDTCRDIFQVLKCHSLIQ